MDKFNFMEKRLEEIIEKCSKDLYVATNSSIKYGTIIGSSAAIGGLIGGRVGLLIGSIISSTLVSYHADNEYVSVTYIIFHKLKPEEKRKLFAEIHQFILNNFPTLLTLTVPYVLNSTGCEISNFIIQYLYSQFNMTAKQRQ